ncbi:hypothetical protein CALVIDRAFT_543148, partial [Calocera viscosa TUFC12733]
MVGCVSPPLLGSNGTIPLTIVSVIPDIMRHYGSVLSRASAEVILCTNYWEPSASSDIIADSLRTLSKRMQDAGGKAVVKLMYDRGTPKQVVQNHAPVLPKDWASVKLPSQEELPGISMEVINFHRPLLGTFHSKYLIVDRKVALLSSNNIQDRPNVEMMIHLEGPIVDSFLDMALLTWHNRMVPPLPSLLNPPGEEGAVTAPGVNGQTGETAQASHHEAGHEYRFGKENPWLKETGLEGKERVGEAREELRRQHEQGEMHGEEGVGGESAPDAGSAARGAGDAAPAATDGEAVEHPAGGDAAQHPAADATGAAANDQTDEAEVKAVDGALFDRDGGKETPAHIAQHLDIKTHVDPTVPQLAGDDFRPHILHKEHEPFPIAMVNRVPHGAPGHEDVRVPQDAAWLAALGYAQQSVFIQTPTFNASPVIPATLDACRRGVTVTLYLDLGFNDSGEQIPGQGGTNEQVVSGMYKTLHEENKGDEKNLKVYWYTSKDQVSPLNAKAKQRNCHVKFMSVDDQIAILGNGNQDTQSWFHSQEINVLVDAPQLIAEWHQGLNANQNTRLYGLVDEDGIWRYKEGEKKGQKLEALGETSGNPAARVKGLTGAVKRVQGKGGF